MIRPAIKIFFFLPLVFILHAQQTSNIKITGNSVFTENEYQSIINSIPRDNFSVSTIDSVKQKISLFLYENAYYNFTLETAFEKDNQNLIIEINEGNPTYINKINLLPETLKDSLYFTHTIESLEGNIFSKQEVAKVFSEILKHYENNAYPFFSLKVDSLFFHSEDENFLVDIFIRQNEGPPCRFDKFIFEGNEKTKGYVMERELPIRKSDKYNQEIIDEIPSILNKTGFFRRVEQPEFMLDNSGNGILKIRVEEKTTNSFDGILGYVPGSGSESGYFTGFVNINLRNLFGTGRAALIKWNQETQSTQELELKYFEPWLFSYPFNITLGLYQRKQDSTYVQRNVSAEVEYRANRNISASLLAASESTIPSEGAGNQVYNSSLFTTGVSLRIDTRDDIYSPRSGLLFNNSYKYTSKTIEDELTPEIGADNNLQRYEIDFSYYQSIFSTQVISLAFHARELRGSFIELSDLYFLGGTSSLRGYRERQFSGNRLIWANLEYRYLFDLRSYLFLFVDSGYFMRREEPILNINFSDDFKTGYGLGVSLETAIGILKVSYALGEGDSFSNGKIHFGIANDF